MRGASGLLEVDFGEFPQTAVEDNFARQLENTYQIGMKETGNKYTTDSVAYDDYDMPFQAREFIEYEYMQERYIRFLGDKNGAGKVLSTGAKIKIGKPYWVKVEKVRWFVDKKNDIVLPKTILFAGVQFNQIRNYKGDFAKTDIKKYMDNCFAKEIQTNKVDYLIPDTDTSIRKTRLQNLNPDTTIASERRKMTYTEMIQNWIEAGESVLLRGPSGIGKTERIRKLYPNLIYLKLTNNMLPEKVVGSSNFQTGQNIPPNFAKQAILNCATEEEKKMVASNIQSLYDLADTIYERSKTSNEKIVILLDELLNVKPVVQSLVYTLVLNRIVETGSGLKLPENTVIVATGNPQKYSSVAEELAEPLEKRFDHILDMEPRVSEWIYEYAIPNQLHPSVIGYIVSKYMENQRREDISSIGYFYEEPEVGERDKDRNGCRGRTNDPRGWTSISHTLCAFEKNLVEGKYVGKDVEHLLQMSIATKLRESWAREFLNYYNIPTLTIEQVVNKTYTQADLPRNTNERYASMVALLLADEHQVGTCREFVQQYCDPEYRELYDLLWVGNDEMRMLKMSELQQLELKKGQIEGVGKSR